MRVDLGSRTVVIPGVFIVALFAVLLVCSPASAAEPDRPELRLSAPEQVSAGEPIRIDVLVKNAKGVGGYETNLLYDTGAAEFGSIAGQAKGIARKGYGSEPLGPAESSLGVSFGAFTCYEGSSGDCTETKKSGKAGYGVGGSRKLATITVVPENTGSIQFRLAGTRLSGTSGNSVVGRMGSPTVTVRVGDSGEEHPAPANVPWRLGSGSSESGDLDFNEDGSVSYADNMASAVAWMDLRSQGRACYSGDDGPGVGDANGNGCVDIGDIQKVAMSYEKGSGNSSGESSGLRSFSTASAGGIFTVNSLLDGPDAAAGDGVCFTADGFCTLRAAIEETNALAGADEIRFDIPGTAGGVRNIKITSSLPAISDATGGTTIDGYTQPGSSANTAELASNANIKVQVTGQPTFAYFGFQVLSSGNTIRGIAVSRVYDPILIYGKDALNNTIEGNFIGTDTTGTFAVGRFISDGSGVTIQNGASYNQIGTSTPAGRNVLSGNGRHGVTFYGISSDYNRVMNNIIGLSPDGTRKVTNSKHGVDINGGASQNIVGGTGQYERNVFSGNTEEGVEISHEYTTMENEIIGNYFGTDLTGESVTDATRNGFTQIQLEDRSSYNIIRSNVVGGSNTSGILFTRSGGGNVVEDNYVGISRSGANIGNRLTGIQISGVPPIPNTVGQRVGPGNIVSNNGLSGVRVLDGDLNDFNTITRNSIFANSPLGIDIEPGGANVNDVDDADSGPNDGQNYPVLDIASTDRVTGTSCGDCKVEVFITDQGSTNPQGRTFVGAATADQSGVFRVPVSGVSVGDYVTATATSASGNTSEFSERKVVVDAQAPAVPSGFVATGEQDRVTLDWDDNTESDLAGYSVYRSEVQGGPYQKISNSLVTNSSYTDSSVTNGTAYYYVVTASDANANESSYSAEQQATPVKSVLLFNGGSDLVKIRDSVLNTTAPKTRTYELAMRTPSDTTTRQFLYESGGTANGTSIEIRNGMLYFNSWGTGWAVVSAGAPVEPRTEYEVAATYNRPTGEMQLYLNGQRVSSVTGAKTIKASADNVALGGVDGYARGHNTAAQTIGSFKGSMSGFRVWNTVRTQSQIVSDAQGNLTGTEASLLLLYRFDEGSGRTLNDATSSDLDGTIFGATWS